MLEMISRIGDSKYRRQDVYMNANSRKRTANKLGYKETLPISLKKKGDYGTMKL